MPPPKQNRTPSRDSRSTRIGSNAPPPSCRRRAVPENGSSSDCFSANVRSRASNSGIAVSARLPTLRHSGSDRKQHRNPAAKRKAEDQQHTRDRRLHRRKRTRSCTTPAQRWPPAPQPPVRQPPHENSAPAKTALQRLQITFTCSSGFTVVSLCRLLKPIHKPARRLRTLPLQKSTHATAATSKSNKRIPPRACCRASRPASQQDHPSGPALPVLCHNARVSFGTVSNSDSLRSA